MKGRVFFEKCFNCDEQAEYQEHAGSDEIDCNCRICGMLTLTDYAYKKENKIPIKKRWILSAWIRNQILLGNKPHLNENYKSEIYDSISNIDIDDKISKTLLMFAKMSDHGGAIVKFVRATDYPLFWATNETEASWIFRELVKQDFLHERSADSAKFVAEITGLGWEKVDKLKQSRTESSQVFVAMWFDKSTDDAWVSGIKKAVEECGYDPLRIDKKEHINKIDDEIIAGIRRSRFLVADTTGQRQGVYFEAGFAMGLGIDVVWCCNENAVEENQFDTRQFNHIVWKSPDDLALKLEHRIKALDL